MRLHPKIKTMRSLLSWLYANRLDILIVSYFAMLLFIALVSTSILLGIVQVSIGLSTNP